MNVVIRTFAVAAAALSLAACGKNSAQSNAPTQPSASADCRVETAGSLRISNAWVRASSDIGGVSAAYFDICNATSAPIEIIGANSAASATVELHTTERDAAGAVSMMPLASIVVGPGETVAFEPGAKHVMLIGLTQSLEAGSTTELALQLADGAQAVASATVKTAAEAAKAAGHNGH